MVVNGSALLALAPIHDMLSSKESFGGVTHGMAEAGYDIRLRQTVRFKSRLFGLLRWVEVEQDGEKHRHFGSFTLASAIEYFQMPNNCLGIVHDKSTLARKGLSVFNTVIEPAWEGNLTLELVYRGRGDLVLEAGQGIAQVIFHELATTAEYKGRYQNQPDRPVPAKDAV